MRKFQVNDNVIVTKGKYKDAEGVVVNIYSINNRCVYIVQIPDVTTAWFYSYQLKEPVFCVASRVKTPDGTILWSRFTHDYVEYHDQVSDEDYMLDGGKSYRRSFVNNVPATDMSVNSDAPWEIQREVILRGTFDSEGRRVWVPISKLSDLHIKNLVFDSGLRMNTPYYKELSYREKHNINIPEHSYDLEGVQSITKTNGNN